MKKFGYGYLVLLILTSCIVAIAQDTRFAKTKSGEKGAAVRLEKRMPELMQTADIPGMSIALVRDGKTVWNRGFGVVNSTTKEPVNAATVFEAASLSKPVFAYAVLKLVDAGRLDLDTPLNKYLPGNYDVVDDERIDKVTARNVLAHTSGFPNWRSSASPKVLPIYFMPGERFSYSGEGFVYLSRVVEKITGMKSEEYVRTVVLEPLGMASSSFVWRPEYKTLKTFNHNVIGEPTGQNEPSRANAAYSLHTTAADYARFVAAVLDGKGLKKRTRDQMLSVQVRVDEACFNCTNRPVGTLSKEVGWGLGVGLQTTGEGTSFWHWGDNGNNKAFFIAFDKQRDGIVMLTNSANGLLILDDVLAEAIGRKVPAGAWLNYGRHDSPNRVLLKSLLADGTEKAIAEYRKQREVNPEKRLDENRMNSLGYTLLRLKKIDESIAVFTLNTEDFPKSANTWDSLGEAYMVKGDKQKAIEYYKRSLALDPDNKSAAENIKRLEQ